jgi:hypothetical protein
MSEFKFKSGPNFEYKTGMINFSVVGNSSSEEERKGENLFLMNLISLLGKYDCITCLLIWHHCHCLISFYSILATECKEI